MGMLFPSSDAQRDLMIQTYKEANVDPLDVTYFEAHGTGTKVFIVSFFITSLNHIRN
jgi:acyl transferase domain-containing protein